MKEMRVDKEEKKTKKRRKERKDGKRKRRVKRIGEREKKISLLSKIYGNRIVGFRQSKRQSRSTHRELRMGTKTLDFRQTL